MEDEFYNNIRIVIANFGLIIIALSKDKLELRDSSSIKIVCFSLSTFISYLVYSLMAILSKVEETVELSWFILDLLVIYLISYHYIKSKLSKGV
jgi:amino acid transporter